MEVVKIVDTGKKVVSFEESCRATGEYLYGARLRGMFDELTRLKEVQHYQARLAKEGKTKKQQYTILLNPFYIAVGLAAKSKVTLEGVQNATDYLYEKYEYDMYKKYVELVDHFCNISLVDSEEVRKDKIKQFVENVITLLN